MDILITICARGGSKGIPKKNVKMLNGMPLIGYTIKIAKKFCAIYKADIALSTDDDEIKDKCAEFELKAIYTRPARLASDSAGKIEVIRHVWEFEERNRNKEYDYVIDLDVTSPMRTLDDLKEAMDQINSKPEALNLFSVNHAERNPYFNMVEEDENGYVHVVKTGNNVKGRQSAPIVYDMNASFYIFRRKFFEEGWDISTTSRSLAFVMKHMCFDLDSPVDFTIMEIIMREGLLDFEL